MYQTTDFRKGLRIEYRGQPWTILDFQHVNPGKGSAFVRTRLKNLETGQVLEVTFKAGVDKVGVPDLDIKEAQFLYKSGQEFTFMDSTSYEQFALTDKELGDHVNFIVEGSVVQVTFYNGRAVACYIDNFVELKVIEAQPNIKGDTSSGASKPVTVETGLTVSVPFHIKKGDTIRVDTRTTTYIEKVR